MSENEVTPIAIPMRRRSFLKWLGVIIGGVGIGAWRIPAAMAACTVFDGAVCYTQYNHTCGNYCGSGLFPDDKWTKYINDDDEPHTCSCMWVGCLGKYRCNYSSSSYWWMRQIGYSYCCDVCS
ncbi:MAG: hypothetical protein U9N78_08180 [Actinomycetota bacterium]|nr:hypothetical protein [Actinomycetota bacterium]